METGRTGSSGGEEEDFLAPISDNPETQRSRIEQPQEFPVPPEILENLSQDQKQQIEQFFSASMTMGMGIGNPITQKITPEHITDVIALTGREVDLEYGDRRHSRLVASVAIGFFLVVLVVFGAFLAYIKSNDLLLELIKIGAVLSGGFGGGYGVAYWRRR